MCIRSVGAAAAAVDEDEGEGCKMLWEQRRRKHRSQEIREAPQERTFKFLWKPLLRAEASISKPNSQLTIQLFIPPTNAFQDRAENPRYL